MYLPADTGTDQIAVLHVGKEAYQPASQNVLMGFSDRRHIELRVD
jgi:hypothetical protein